MIPKRSELIARYGDIDLTMNPPWPGAEAHMVLINIPILLQGHMLFRTGGGQLVQIPRIYCNRDMAAPLIRAMMNIVERQLMAKVHEFGGCFNIRKIRGGEALSAHAYGLAVDINPSENPLGSAPSLDGMHPELVKCFTDEGFTWGGSFERLDPMHFQYLIED